MTRRVAAVILFIAVAGVYLATFSSAPTSDASTWALTIDRPDWDYMTLAAHPLPVWVGSVVTRALTAARLNVPSLTVMRTLNAFLAAAGAVLFYALVLLLSDDVVLALAGGALLAASFGYWYFANGEIHHWGVVLVLALFVLIVRRRRLGPPGTAYGFAIGVGFLNALAIIFHQDAVLFGFAVVAMLLVDRPWRPALREVAVYIVAGSVGTAVLAVCVAVFIRGVGSVREFFAWYFWPTWHMGVGIYDVGGVSGSVLRSLKAQLTAILYGTQIAFDVVRDSALSREPLTIVLLALTLVAFGIVAALVVLLWRRRTAVRRELLVPLIGCLVWIAVYKLFLNSWFQPASTEYHVVSVPALLVILLLGPIAERAARRRPWRAAVVALVVAVFVVNLWGAILPWLRYGRMKDALALSFEPAVRAGALFISSESGLDSVFLGHARHVGVKDVFRQTSGTDGFPILDTMIREQLAHGGRVFVYNLTPNPFTLRRINLEAGKRGDPPMAFGDFERFAGELRARYAFVPAAAYWEEAKTPLFLFGRRFETVWEVRAGAG